MIIFCIYIYIEYFYLGSILKPCRLLRGEGGFQIVKSVYKREGDLGDGPYGLFQGLGSLFFTNNFQKKFTLQLSKKIIFLIIHGLIYSCNFSKGEGVYHNKLKLRFSTSQWILKLSKMAIFIKASIKESKKKERWRTWIHFETLFKL